MERIDHTGHTWHDATPKARARCRKMLADMYLTDPMYVTDADMGKAYRQRNAAGDRRRARLNVKVDATLERAREAGLIGPYRIGAPVTVMMSDAPPNLPGVVIAVSGSYITVQLDAYRRPVTLLKYDVTPRTEEK